MRHAAEDCRLEDIRGGVDIDVGNVQIKAARLGGRVRIYNRFGPNAVTSIAENHHRQKQAQESLGKVLSRRQFSPAIGRFHHV